MKELIAGAILGFIIGILLYEWLDPPPPEVINAIARSEWARRLASAYVSPELPPEQREKIIDELARKLAERLATRLYP